jgi:excisionase family DNA binding protein
MGLWKIDEAADYLGIRPKTLYEWVRLDRVPYRKIGFNVRFDPEELENWTAEQSRGGGAAKAPAGAAGATKRKGAAKGKGGTSGGASARSARQPASVAGEDSLARLAVEAAAVLRELERDLGASLSFPQRRKLLDLADRLGRAASD